MAVRPLGYTPFTPDQWAEISKQWEKYKAAIGLEGNTVLEGLAEGKSLDEINKELTRLRPDLEAVRAEWNNERSIVR